LSLKDELRSRALSSLHSFIDELKKSNFSIRCLLLFGSYARGDFTEESDIDVCVIAEGLPVDELERRTLRRYYKTPKVQAVAYTPQEFLDMMQALNPIVLDIMHEGIVLLDDGFCQSAKTVFAEVCRKHKLVREGEVWRWEVKPQPHE